MIVEFVYIVLFVFLICIAWFGLAYIITGLKLKNKPLLLCGFICISIVPLALSLGLFWFTDGIVLQSVLIGILCASFIYIRKEFRIDDLLKKEGITLGKLLFFTHK